MEKQNMTEAIQMLDEAWSEAARLSTNIAYHKRTMYLAYLHEGFTEEQALELIKAL